MLVQLKNGKPIGNAVADENFFMLYPDTSFPYPLTPSDVEPFGYGLYEFSSQPTPSTYEKVVEVTPVKNASGIWMQTWAVVPMTPEEVAAKNEQLKQQNKQQAEARLYETDWTTIPDVSDPALSDPYLTNSAEFAAYRSNVRKIAVNPPVTVDVWPVEPEEVWAYTDA
jgi:hypothetical protein